jgi:hypothetical protein
VLVLEAGSVRLRLRLSLSCELFVDAKNSEVDAFQLLAINSLSKSNKPTLSLWSVRPSPQRIAAQKTENSNVIYTGIRHTV